MKYGKYPKAYSFKRIDSKSISERTLKNSLMFLLEGIQQIETNTRQSIVSFWTGVEIFIKSLLVEEHWSLIVKDRITINHKDFENGDFVSIDFQQSIALLENVFNITLKMKTRNAFETIRKHRNKIIHFTNTQIEDRNAFELCYIFVEMSNVWDELQGLRLPVIDFDENDLPKLYDNITNAINNHKVILEGKYQNVYELNLRHIKDDDIFLCSSCNYKAVVVSAVNSIICEARCLVCSDENDVLKVECERCNNVNILYRSKTVCANCQEQLDLMSHILGDTTPKNSNLVATCHRCGSQSVVNIESIWFCLNCFSYHSTVAICYRCGSSVTHSTRKSHLDGCICCDGRMP